MNREIRHVPVLLKDVLEVLSPQPGQVIVDCTLSLCGHSAALLECVGETRRIVGIDFDPGNIALARAALQKISGRVGNFDLIHNNFAALPMVLE